MQNYNKLLWLAETTPSTYRSKFTSSYIGHMHFSKRTATVWVRMLVTVSDYSASKFCMMQRYWQQWACYRVSANISHLTSCIVANISHLTSCIVYACLQEPSIHLHEALVKGVQLHVSSMLVTWPAGSWGIWLGAIMMQSLLVLSQQHSIKSCKAKPSNIEPTEELEVLRLLWLYWSCTVIAVAERQTTK